MARNGVKLTTLTERFDRNGRVILTGRLGDAVVIGFPIENHGDAPRRWKLTLVPGDFGERGRPSASVTDAEWARFADRARASRPVALDA